MWIGTNSLRLDRGLDGTIWSLPSLPIIAAGYPLPVVIYRRKHVVLDNPTVPNLWHGMSFFEQKLHRNVEKRWIFVGFEVLFGHFLSERLQPLVWATNDSNHECFYGNPCGNCTFLWSAFKRINTQCLRLGLRIRLGRRVLQVTPPDVRSLECETYF